jgi:hypothetical protein
LHIIRFYRLFDGAKLLLFCETAVTLFAGKVSLSKEKHFSVALPSFITPPLDRAMTERQKKHKIA